MSYGIDLKKIIDSVCRKMCPPQQPHQNTVTFTDEEVSLILSTRQRLRQWLDLAQAGVIGAPMQSDLKTAIMEIINIANKLYEWYVPPFRIDRVALSEQELQNVVNDLKRKGGLQEWLRLDGTYYTTDLGTLKKIIEWDWTDTRKYLTDTFDCLLPDTPIIYKDPVTGEINIDEVQNMSQEGGFYVLDMSIEDGSNELRWTRVNWVRPKYSSKRIVTVATPDGFIQTTEDHRFWVDGEWRQIGEYTGLDGYEEREKVKLTTAPIEKLFRDDIELDPELAWVYGLFLAEGNATTFMTRTGLGHYFHIDMCNEDALIKAKEVLENHFNTKFEVYLPHSQQKGRERGGVRATCDLYRLVVRDERGANKRIALMFRQMFYTRSGSKKVPPIVLNAVLKAKRAFIEGVMLGDGTYNAGEGTINGRTYRYAYRRLWQKSRVAMLGIKTLLKKLSIPHRFYYYRRKSGQSYLILELREGSARKPRQPLFYVENSNSSTLVYDLNTETSHFIASTFLVHNCDKFAMYFKARQAIDFHINAIGMVIDYSAGHAYNIIIIKDPSTGKVTWYLLEPQNDSIFTYDERDKNLYAMQYYYLIL